MSRNTDIRSWPEGARLFDNRIEKPLDVKAMAEWLGVNPNTLKTWVSTGREQIPYFRLGNRSMFFKSSVTEWMRSKEKGMK